MLLQHCVQANSSPTKFPVSNDLSVHTKCEKTGPMKLYCGKGYPAQCLILWKEKTNQKLEEVLQQDAYGRISNVCLVIDCHLVDCAVALTQFVLLKALYK